MRRFVLGAPVLGALVWNCGISADPPAADAGLTASDSGTADAAPADGSSTADGAGPTEAAAPDASSCVEGAACASNTGAPCIAGRIICGASGPQCVDGPRAADGTLCTTGLCTAGVCRSPTTLSGSNNLSTMSVTPGRTCASEAPAFSVTALAPTTATVSVAPMGDCLVAGDEVVLMNAQGVGAATANTGNWETLEVASVTGTTVTFTAPRTKSYGSAATNDTGIGVGAADQKVFVMRVPKFGDLTVAAGASLTANPWNGRTGGIVALRAAKLTVNGTITAEARGYRSGRWSQDDGDCQDNALTEAGESINGPAVASVNNNGGGAGGIGAATAISFVGNTPASSGSSHATAGGVGKNGNGRTIGSPGAIYGANDGSRLTMGSGTAGNVTCSSNSGGPALIPAFDQTAGGIVFVTTGRLDMGAAGKISASAVASSRDVSASGGYVYIRGGTLNVGTARVTAIGATAVSQNTVDPGVMPKSGDGYIVLSGTVTGTTTPVANVLP